MAEIVDLQVIAFSNGRIRPSADALTSDYYRAKSIIEDYNTGGIAAKITAGGTGNLIADGSATDGRVRITGTDLVNYVAALIAFVAFVEGGVVATLARLDTITKPHVNTF